MSIAFQCTNCGRTLRANPEMAGKRTKCPGCATILTIPSAEGASAPAKPATPRPTAAAPAPTPAAAPAAAAMVACECGTKIRTKPEWAGKTIKCPKCEARIKVPGGAPAPAAAPVKPAAPVKKPAPPPPPVEDDPFGGSFDDNQFAGGANDFADQPFSGGAASFNDDSAEAEAPVRPARRAAAAPPPKKKGKGGRIALFSLLIVLLILGGAFALFTEQAMGLVNSIMGKPDVTKPIAKIKVLPKDDDDEEPKDKTPKVDGKKDDKNVDEPVVDPVPEKKEPVDPTPPVKKTPAVANAISLVPSDALGFVSIKPQPLLKTKLGQEYWAGMAKGPGGKVNEAFVSAFGVGATDLSEIIIVSFEVPEPGANPVEKSIFIISTTKPYNIDGFNQDVDGKKFTKKEADGVVYFATDDPMPAAFVPMAANILVAGPEDVVVKYLSQKRAADGPLAPMIKNAATDHLLFVGFQVPPKLAESALENAPDMAKEMAAPFVEIQSGEVAVTGGKSVKLIAKLNFPDEEKAGKAKDGIGGLLFLGNATLPELKKQAPPGFEKVIALGEAAFKSIAPSTAGHTVTVPVTINASVDDLADLMSMFIRKGPPPQPKIEEKKIEEKKVEDESQVLESSLDTGRLTAFTAVRPELISVDPRRVD